MANKTYQSIKHFGLRASAVAVASCLALAVPLTGHAAGLGRIAVFSALGQPLRAEIELSATRDELADMKAQLASPETFKQAGIDYATTLLNIRFSLDKRQNGKAVIRLSSDRPINDPFVDLLLELNWPSGRLVREYTFLLDPPEFAAKSAQTAAPVAVPAAVSRPQVGRAVASTIDSDVRARAVAKVHAVTAVAKPESPLAGGETREVRRGETLHRIATESRPEGVSLEQMLVGLLRANPDAFEGGNMNRLKAGRILTLPDRTTVESVAPGEARKIVLAQSSDWNAYRGRLAGVAASSPAREDSARQQTTGKITARVEEAADASAAPKDQLKVSRTEAAKKPAAASGKKDSSEDAVAKDNALREANARMMALEKNVADLQKLLELRNQSLAELQKQSVAKPEAAPVAPAMQKPPVVAKPETTPAVVAPATPPAPTPPAEAPAKVEPAPPMAATPAEQKAPEKPKAVVPSPQEPGFFDTLLENPMALAGGGGVLALIAAYFAMRRRRASAESAEQDLTTTLTPPSVGAASLATNSVFRSTGGQSVDTSSQTPAQTDFSQAGPGSIDTDEVDPVAEADVYMAYGRDAQAEEILLEARQKDPKRLAIPLKLLEIYAGRKDLKHFETLATDLYGETNGNGPDWDKVVAMGTRLDPDNPLFRNSAAAIATATAAEAVSPEIPDAFKNTVTLPGDISQLAKEAELTAEESLPSLPTALPATTGEASDLTSLDFDLAVGETRTAPNLDTVEAETPVSASAADAGTIDFDLGIPTVAKTAPEENEQETAPMDLGLPEIFLEDVQPQTSAASVETGTKETFQDLDFDIGTRIVPMVDLQEEQEAVEANSKDIDFDLGSVDFDSASVREKAAPDVSPASATGSVGEVAGGDESFAADPGGSTFTERMQSELPSFDLSSIDLDLQAPEMNILATEVQEAASESAGAAGGQDTAFESAQVSTAIYQNFETNQLETAIAPLAHAETVVNPDFSAQQAETQFAQSLEFAPDSISELDAGANEEVATKLDLAKAYEEMGDLEGARELLQEVLKEGNMSQREVAQNLLGKIGG